MVSEIEGVVTGTQIDSASYEGSRFRHQIILGTPVNELDVPNKDGVVDV